MRLVGQWDKREFFLYAFAAIASISISAFISYQENVINPDAICYLLSAQAINNSGLISGMHLCSQANWPFYSLLVATLTKFSAFSYVNAAFALNACFSALSVLFFVAISKELGASLRVMVIAAAVILLSHELNSVRQYIVRDHGYWASYLASLYFLIRFFQTNNKLYPWLFSASLLAAALFRIEGAVFLLALPFLVWFNSTFTWRERAKAFFALNRLTIMGGVGLVVGLFFFKGSANKLGRLPELLNQVQHGFSLFINQFQALKQALATYILNTDSANQAGTILIGMFVAWYLIGIMSNLSWIYGLLVIYAWWKNVTNFKPAARLAVYGYLLINVLITFVFLIERLFLSSRYLVGLSLILMLWVPFALDYLWQHMVTPRQKIVMALITIAILTFAATGIMDLGYSKTYIRSAGNWLQQNVPASTNLYANDIQLMYYSKHFGNDIFKQLPIDHDALKDNKWQQYDYVALRSSKKGEEKLSAIVNAMQLKPTAVFMNKRGDNVSIYKIPHVEKVS